MKRTLLIAIAIATSTISTAQVEYNYINLWAFKDYYAVIVKTQEVKDATVDITTTKLKNGKQRFARKKYDKHGNLVEYANIKDGKAILNLKNEFNEDNKLINCKGYTRKGSIKHEVDIKRNNLGKYETVQEFGRNNKLKWTKEWIYTVNDCIEKSLHKNGKGKLKNTWLYEYYAKCDKKKSVLLKGNGKIKKVWTYDCKQEGEELIKKKDVTQICKWEETDDEYLIKTTQSLDGRGKIYSMVYKYRAIDTAVVNYKKLDGNKELVYEYFYDFDYEKPLGYTYYKKGKAKWGNKYTYLNNKIVSFQFLRKGEVSSEIKYKYNSENVLTDMKTFKKDGELSSTTAFTYN